MKRLLIFVLAFLLIYTAAVVAINFPRNEKPLIDDSLTQENDASPSGKVISDITTQGEGDAAKNGDTVTVHYTGTLQNGTKFDSSKDSGKPFTFRLGQGEVIQGWDEGVLGMKVGEVRKLTIPSELGYGNIAQGAIPANSTLIFEVELLSIQPSGSDQTPQIDL